MKAKFTQTLTTLCGLCLAGYAQAAPGDLDPTFYLGAGRARAATERNSNRLTTPRTHVKTESILGSMVAHMLHHISFAVTDLERSGAFYDAALSCLGYVRVWADKTAVGYGLPGGDDKFAIKLRPDGIVVPGDGFHLAFAAHSRDAVNGFYSAALKHAGKDNGGAGLHPEYGPHYYAGFVYDPDGYRVEAVINEKV